MSCLCLLGCKYGVKMFTFYFGVNFASYFAIKIHHLADIKHETLFQTRKHPQKHFQKIFKRKRNNIFRFSLECLDNLPFMKILIIEDEPDLLFEIKNFLEKENYVCEVADNFLEADEKMAVYHYDMALIDITLPGGSGLKLIDNLKQQNTDTGIIIISARNSLDDKLTGLDLGADDYITKPFHLSELNARIKAVFRRRKFEGSTSVIFNEIELLPDYGKVKILDKSLILTKKEFEILLFFIANKNRLLTRESIAEHLWGDNIDLADNFDFIYTHINNLRKKIVKAGGNDYIKSVYGIGYKFTAE